jgi:hypothetical protein
LNHLGGATAIGPILVGMARPVHVLERGADVQDIVNMAAVAVVDAQERTYPMESHARSSNGGPLPDDLFEVMMAIQTTPQDDAGLQGKVGLEAQGLKPSGEVHWNLMSPALIENAIRRGEGQLADMGPFCSVTTPHTGRSPNDKFLVKEPLSEADVDWGKVNQPFSDEQFETLRGRPLPSI